MTNQLKPGRELDALVARKVFGLKTQFPKTDNQGTLGYDPFKPYSTDIAAAWEIVEHLAPKHLQYHFNLTEFDKGGEWMCSFMFGQYGKGKSAPHAICLAALKVVGG